MTVTKMILQHQGVVAMMAGMSTMGAFFGGAGRINLAGGNRLLSATRTAREANRTRTVRSYYQAGSAITQAAKRRSSSASS